MGMPWHDWVSDTYDRLRNSGADVQFTLDEGVDHADEVAEGKWIRSFLAEMWDTLGSTDDSSRVEAAQQKDLASFQWPPEFQRQMMEAYQQAMQAGDPNLFFQEWERMKHQLPPGVQDQMMMHCMQAGGGKG